MNRPFSLVIYNLQVQSVKKLFGNLKGLQGLHRFLTELNSRMLGFCLDKVAILIRRIRKVTTLLSMIVKDASYI
jgi:hypothetical protein